MSRFYSDMLGHLRHVSKKVIKFSKSLSGNHSKPLIFQSFIAFLIIGSLLCFFIVVGSSYFYMFPSSQSIVDNNHNLSNNRSKSVDVKIKSCNLFDGKWVIDETHNPLYNASQCPFAESGFDCLSNGRRDKGYLKWRWKPRDCEIPKLDVKKLLEFLRGKRVVFVGDSLTRTQWESMICMLMSGVEDKRSVFEVNGNEITKRIRHLKVRFDTFDLTIEFYRSIFLVQPVNPPKRSPKRVKTTVKLDQIDDVSAEWSDSDVLVFNSGHWWTPTKLYEIQGLVFSDRWEVKAGFPIRNAFKAALVTWKTWIQNSVNPNRTRVFFRTFESTHWSSGSRQNCKVTRRPLTNVRGKQTNWISDEIVNAVSNVSIHVEPLHVTRMGAFRSDAHVGSWSDNPSVPDCSHWCLPGVPDMWNEILFYYLLNR